uniref:Ysc84 actin-binding domain-containing protein n=2 Tax=Corethron hystrix TaxID=216773 RepID=A0A7S1C1S4_9STRA|mmetsp:Transcript_9203/g.20324  ORF Transcript_9203/g.20324 Transcript_9203/m.20324 type:complete len:212 (+) Transcript_9203:1211-1846(+)
MCGNHPLSQDRKIPIDLLKSAHGLLFLTVARGGLFLSGRVGTGLVVARRPNRGWSPPCAVGTLGLGWGAVVGADVTEFLFVFNQDRAVEALAAGHINFGAEVAVSAGPIGRGTGGRLGVGTDGKGVVPVYCYSHSKGLFAGISVEGSVVVVRDDVNAKFYGRPVMPSDLLVRNGVEGQRGVRAAKVLYDALDEACNVSVSSERAVSREGIE